MNEEKQELKLEDALNRLDEVVAALERENVNLEDSLRFYEEGVRLVAACNEKLNDAERQIRVLRVSADGELREEPWEVAQ